MKDEKLFNLLMTMSRLGFCEFFCPKTNARYDYDRIWTVRPSKKRL